jgi:hypothetical protein
MPLRSAIDLRQFHRFARWMVIAEPDLENRKVPMRLVGSGFHDVLGRDVTGMDYLEFADASIRTRAFEAIMAIINTPCALWQVAPTILSNGKAATVEFTTFPMFNERENKYQFLAFAKHQFADSVQSDGKVHIMKAAALKWLDLGKGMPAFGKCKTAA